MPPKAKFSREEIISAALQLVREGGVEAVTARELGARLGSSARPIFTVFESMEEVLAGVKETARALYGQYVRRGLRRRWHFVASAWLIYGLPCRSLSCFSFCS